MAEQLPPSTGFTRPIDNMRMVKFDADTLAGSRPERERLRTIGVLGLRMAPDHVFDPQREVSPSIAALANIREKRFEWGYDRGTAYEVDHILEGLHVDLTAQLEAAGIEGNRGTQRLAHDVMLARGDLRYLQEAWRDSLDDEIATRLTKGVPADEEDSTDLFSNRYYNGAEEVIKDDRRLRRASREYDRIATKPDASRSEFDRAFQAFRTAEQRNKEVKANFRSTKRARQSENSIPFIGYSWSEVEQLANAFGVDLQWFLRRPNFISPHWINDHTSSAKLGVGVSIWRNIQEGRQDGYDFILEFRPDEQARIAVEPLLPVNYQTR